MSEKRRDNKGRILRTGESQRKTECMNSVTQMPIKSVVPSMTWI